MNHPPITRGPYPQTTEIPVPLVVHESVSPLAAELLMKVTDILHRNPENYNQARCNTYWCGTPLCIYGHMANILGKKVNGVCDEDRDASAKEVGLTKKQLEALFYTENWPTAHGKFMHDATPEQGIARIEHFLRTGE